MKLLFFASDFKIGLSDLLVEEMIFLNRQPELDLVALAGEKEQSIGLSKKVQESNIAITRIAGLDEHRNFLSLAKEIHRVIKDKEFKFVHVQNNWQLSLIVFIKYYYRKNFKIIYTIHGYRNDQYFKSILAKTIIDIALFLFADIVFAASSVVKNKFPLIRWKCNILFLGVEERYFIKTLPDFNQPHKNLIYAGQFRHGKNQEMIINATSIFIQKTGKKDFKFYLAGDGPSRAQCIKKVYDLNLQENIIFPGHLSRNEIFDLYCRCQIAVIPSDSETFGQCIAEPFVLGLCVITRAVGIAKDLIEHRRNGLFFENATDLAVILEKHMEDKYMLERLGNEAYIARDILRWNSICNRYMEFLFDFLNQKQHRN